MQRTFIILFFMFSSLIVWGNTIEVCENCDISKISEAITLSSAGDTIKVNSGTYQEHEILIDKKLTIIGKQKPVVDGTKTGHVFMILADSVELSGLRVINVGKSYTKDFAGIYISRSKHFKISNMILEDVFFGILVEKSHFGVISGNLISSHAVEEAGAGNGIHLWHCSNVLIDNNEIHNVRDGIYFEFVEDSRIINNYSHNNIRYGLHFMFSHNDEYEHNTFTNNGAGVAVMFSKFIKMKYNTFLHNWGTASYGLLLKEINDAEIENNLIQENTIGIFIEGSNRINYKRNNLVGNGWAIKIAGACYTNIFTMNNFLYNSFDVSYNSKINDNSFNNNYWSSYSGYDLDRDGVGDVPFRPVKLFSYVVNKTPETIVLLRSLFVDIINFSEKVSPVFTPDNLKDESPLMRKIQ